MVGWRPLRWWHYLIPGRVAEIRASNLEYVRANSFEAYRAKIKTREIECQQLGEAD